MNVYFYECELLMCFFRNQCIEYPNPCHFVPLASIFTFLLYCLDQVKAIYLCPVPFSIDNGLMTPTLKFKRPAIAAHFDDKINLLYEEIENTAQKKNPFDKAGW